MGDTEMAPAGNEEASVEVASSEGSVSENNESTPPASDLTATTGSSDSSTGSTPGEDLSSSSFVPPTDASTKEMSPTEKNDLSSLGSELSQPGTQPELVTPPSTEPLSLDTPSTDSAATTQGTEALTAGPAPEAASTATEPKTGKASLTTTSTSKIPAIPSEAIQKGKANLNRYYFVRSGDTPESLSQLFYGSADHVKEIISWNVPAKSWKAGTLIYFVSADQPDDNEMSSFYEEQGISTDTYTVKTGDQLSTIAAQKYGNMMSWKEIASLNHLANPDHIKPGQQLTILPTQMTSIHTKPAAVTAQLPPAAPAKPAEPEVRVLTEEDQEEMAFGGPAVEKQPIGVASQKLPAPKNQTANQMEKSKETHMAALEVAQPEQTNMTGMALGGGFACLALFLFLVRRSRSKARAEFLD